MPTSKATVVVVFYIKPKPLCQWFVQENAQPHRDPHRSGPAGLSRRDRCPNSIEPQARRDNAGADVRRRFTVAVVKVWLGTSRPPSAAVTGDGRWSANPASSRVGWRNPPGVVCRRDYRKILIAIPATPVRVAWS